MGFPGRPRPGRSAHDHDDRSRAADDHFRRCGARPTAARPSVEARSASDVSAALIAGLLAGYGIAMPVGAVATYLVALTARTSLKVGASAALGVATADGLYALISMVGGSALAPAIKQLTLPLHGASVLVLVALACRSAVTAVAQFRGRKVTGRTDRELMSPARAYLGLLGITMMNPITVIYFAALVLAGQGTSAAGPWGRAAFVLAAFAASASWQLLLAAGGAVLGHVLTGAHGRLCTSLVSSAVIIGLAAHVLVSPP
jgi:arginine exporter protein ArgO